VYDAFGTNGVGTSISAFKGGTTGVRSSNGIGWKSPTVGGVALWAQSYMGENASTAAKVGNGNGFRLTFDQGKFSAAFADSTLTTGAGTTNKTSNLGASYDLGVAKLMAQSNTTKITGAADIKGSNIGALVPMAGGTFRVSQAQTDQAGKKAKQMSVGFVQPMSKRTDLYATYARVSNSGGSAVALNGAATAANASSTGYEFGVKHAF
jgi:predicted porin